MKKQILTTNKAYSIKSFKKGEYEIEIKGNSLYGENETRNELKVVDVNGFLFYNVEKIVVKSDSMVMFDFYNAEGQEVARYIMNIYETLTVKTTSMDTLKYNFKDVIA